MTWDFASGLASRKKNFYSFLRRKIFPIKKRPIFEMKAAAARKSTIIWKLFETKRSNWNHQNSGLKISLSLSLSLPSFSLSLSFFLSFSLSSSSLDISLSLNLTNLFVFLCWCCRRQSQPQETVEHAKHAFYQIVIRFHQIFYYATTFIKRSIFLSW